MCGIAGFVDFSGRDMEGADQALARMAESLAHRGPDGWGRAVLRGAIAHDVRARERRTFDRPAGETRPLVGLAHRRLAIIDLSDGGHQPMRSVDGRSWIVYNGELYNYRELAAELRDAGASLHTASDTEVLLASLEANDLGALSRLRGMFAFAWWDERRSRLVLARDRFGIKPLVFAETAPGQYWFASEPAALAAGGAVTLRPEPSAARRVLARGALPADASFWSGVQMVAPGETVVIDARGVTRMSYWSLAATLLQPPRRATVTAVAATLRHALESSVRAHLVSDVPVGIFLSGGLDSTALLATAQHIGAGPIRTFTVTMGEAQLDEADAARQAARQFGGDHTELRVGDLDLDATLDAFFAAMADPSVDGLNTFIVSRAAAQAGVRVVLSGVGGDEWLGGYPSFTRVPQLSAVLRRISPVGRASLSGAASLFGRRADKLRALAGASPDLASVWWQFRAVTPGAPGDTARPPALPAEWARASAFAKVRYLEAREFLEGQLLRDADAFTMASALELRTPFVDHELCAAVTAAGEWPRGDARSFKAALFAALPDLTRAGGAAAPKQGFVLPMAQWMREALSAHAPVRWRDLRPRLEAAGQQALIERFLAGRAHWSRLWTPYVLARMTRG